MLKFVEVVMKATEGPNFNFHVPVILSVQPLEGKPGTEVVLTGKYFSEEPENNLVQLRKNSAVTENDSTQSLTVILNRCCFGTGYRHCKWPDRFRANILLLEIRAGSHNHWHIANKR